jgi:hypothetical protein
LADVFADAKKRDYEGLILVPFQPKVIVEARTVEQLAEWERIFAEECGMPVPAKPEGAIRPEMDKEWVRGETIGGCTGGWDYCDYKP